MPLSPNLYWGATCHKVCTHINTQRETQKSLPAGWGSKGPCAGGHTMQACWGEYLRGHWGCWGPEVWMKLHQTPLEEDLTWEAYYHLYTTHYTNTLQHKHTVHAFNQYRAGHKPIQQNLKKQKLFNRCCMQLLHSFYNWTRVWLHCINVQYF